MRVKRGVTAHQKHRKVIRKAKGMTHARRSSSRLARQGVVRSLQYAYRDRRNRKRDFRSLWITRISAAAKVENITYSQLIKQLSNLPNLVKPKKLLLNKKAPKFRGFFKARLPVSRILSKDGHLSWLAV